MRVSLRRIRCRESNHPLRNHHGIRERHDEAQTCEIDFPGLQALYRAWREGLPADKRDNWYSPVTRTLHVHIGSAPDRSDLEETPGAIDAGDDIEPQPSRLNVESLETFQRAFRATNLERLHAIANHEPDSIRDLARTVDRHPPEVTDNINELVDDGLVKLKEEGRAKRPTLWYDEIEVEGDISLRDSGADPALA